jgi:hypothetical protein
MPYALRCLLASTSDDHKPAPTSKNKEKRKKGCVTGGLEVKGGPRGASKLAKERRNEFHGGGSSYLYGGYHMCRKGLASLQQSD